MSAQSSPLRSCSSSWAVKSSSAGFGSGVFPTSIPSPVSLRVSSKLSSSDSARLLSSIFLNRSSTRPLLLSPGVPTDRGENVAGSCFLYSVRATYNKAPGTFLWQTSSRLSARCALLLRSSCHHPIPVTCSPNSPDRAFSRCPEPRILEALSPSFFSLESSMSLS